MYTSVQWSHPELRSVFRAAPRNQEARCSLLGTLLTRAPSQGDVSKFPKCSWSWQHLTVWKTEDAKDGKGVVSVSEARGGDGVCTHHSLAWIHRCLPGFPSVATFGSRLCRSILSVPDRDGANVSSRLCVRGRSHPGWADSVLELLPLCSSVGDPLSLCREPGPQRRVLEHWLCPHPPPPAWNPQVRWLGFREKDKVNLDRVCFFSVAKSLRPLFNHCRAQ